MIVIVPDNGPGAADRLIPLTVDHRPGVLLPGTTATERLKLTGERHLHTVLLTGASTVHAELDRADLELWLMRDVNRPLLGPVQRLAEALPMGVYWLQVRAPTSLRRPGGRYALSLRCVLSSAPAS